MNRKKMRTFAAAVLIGSMLVTPAYAENAVISGSEVNLRSGPGTNYRVVGSLSRGTSVEVTDRSNSEWCAVDIDGQTCFISSRYLSFSDNAGSDYTITDYAEGMGYVNAMYVRFRSGPGSAYSVIGTYNTGKAVEIIGNAGEWTACIIDGQRGYVYSDYISAYNTEISKPSFEIVGTVSDAEEIPSLPSFSIPLFGTEQVPSASAEPEPTATPGFGSIIIGAVPTPLPTAAVTAAPTPTPAPTPNVSLTPTPEPSPTPVPSPLFSPIPIEPAQSVQPSETPAPTEETGEGGVQGIINGDYVRFRSGPGTTYSIIDLYNKGKALTVISENGEWTECVIDGQRGYVYSAYVLKQSNEDTETEPPQSIEIPVPTEEALPEETPINTPEPSTEPAEHKPGYISGNNVRMRYAPSMSSGIICELFYGNKLTITGTSGDWTAVIYDGTEGYVYSSYVKEGSFEYSDTTSDSNGTVEGKAVAEYALNFVGYNYCWGGTSPETGFDCSGLVYYVYGQFGYRLNRVAADQARNGEHVDELEPGDILCFYSGSSYIGHVGIYIGGGKFVHAANSTAGVIVSDLSGYYASRGYEARRIV